MEETVYQTSRAGEEVGSVSAEVAGETVTVLYSLSGTHADNFRIDENTGDIVVADPANALTIWRTRKMCRRLTTTTTPSPTRTDSG